MTDPKPPPEFVPAEDPHGAGNHHHHDGDDHHHTLSLAFQTYLRHDKEEQAHWEDVCRAYRQYATFAMCHWTNQRHRLGMMLQRTPSVRSILPKGLVEDTPESKERFQTYKDATIRNQFCLDSILRHAGMAHSQQVPSSIPQHEIATDRQISKVSSVLKSLVRDWSMEGKPERDMAYTPLLEHLRRFLPVDPNAEVAPKVCVPGAGVGRLALELTTLGYRVQGNEFSLYMLLASDFILNSGTCNPTTPLTLSPWLLESRNVHAADDPMRKVSIPDIDPSAVLANEPDFSMAAGDFTTIYSHPREAAQWDAIVCCFFLDAAPNIVDYIKIIHTMLREGGLLLSFGPLLYHFSGPAMRPDDLTISNYQSRFSYLDKRYLDSVDLCWEDVREILQNIGFDLVYEKVGVRSLYTADRKSMMNMAYRCVSFVAKKKKSSTTNANNSGEQVPAVAASAGGNGGGGRRASSSISSEEETGRDDQTRKAHTRDTVPMEESE